MKIRLEKELEDLLKREKNVTQLIQDHSLVKSTVTIDQDG